MNFLEIGSPMSQPSPLLPPIREENAKSAESQQNNESLTWPRNKTAEFSPKSEKFRQGITHNKSKKRMNYFSVILDKKHDDLSTKSPKSRTSPELSQSSSIFKKIPLPEGISFTRKVAFKGRHKLSHYHKQRHKLSYEVIVRV